MFFAKVLLLYSEQPIFVTSLRGVPLYVSRLNYVIQVGKYIGRLKPIKNKRKTATIFVFSFKITYRQVSSIQSSIAEKLCLFKQGAGK